MRRQARRRRGKELVRRIEHLKKLPDFYTFYCARCRPCGNGKAGAGGLNYAGLLLLLLMLSRRVFHYFFNDSLLSSFHHLRRGFWGVDCPFGGSGGVGPFGVSGTGWPFGALGVDWPFRSLVVDWPFGVLGGLRPRDFGIHYSGQIRRPAPA